MQNGLISETSADTLMGYGYMQSSVSKVSITIDLDLDNGSSCPKVFYTIELEKRQSKLHSKVKHFSNSKTIWGKFRLFLLLRKGGPIPGVIEDKIARLAKEYLPENYQVNIDVK